MPYTSTDLANIESAILKLASGEWAVSVSDNGMRIEYGQADHPQLRSLRAEIRGELTDNLGGKTILISTSKGL